MTEIASASIINSSVFTAASLPIAIGNLFRMNNYHVDYDVHVHGAQIDIVARSKGDPFSLPVYIEATIEYVSTEKYGKDTTKFLLLARKQPGSTLLCVSSSGFTANVKERAFESGVNALSYDELFAKFEKFSPYLDAIFSMELTRSLVSTYEEPFFNDSKGMELATKWLGFWKGYAPDEAKWLIVLGEYGTGKTSLTRVLQYRWLKDYHADPACPIPVRIELRNFSRQFDANGLLHHFLDTNALSHVPIEFMTHLIRTGRMILILDGYDEMAQFMNSRERRACLAALAELAKEGAKGILTSRPNYFSETEELHVFEALYRNLEQQRYHLTQNDTDFILKEKSVDTLIERYVLNRYERSLQDLTPQQTESLVQRILRKNIAGQQMIISILRKVFREEVSGSRQALSGKPVIIAYLLELVEELQKEGIDLSIDAITEWQIYKLIVDRLMLRDLQRSTLPPPERRRALQNLAIRISSRDEVVASEEIFLDLLDSQFQSELRRLSPDERRLRRSELFEDLRSSATLTRAAGTKQDGWVFSHNSLREYLVSEIFLDSLSKRNPVQIRIPISAAMRAFVASIGQEGISDLWQALSELWPRRASNETLGPYLTLLWDAASRSNGGVKDKLALLGLVGQSNAIAMNMSSLKDLDFGKAFGSGHSPIDASGSVIADCKFDAIDLSQSNFDSTILDNTSFRDCNLCNSIFKSSYLFECDLSGAVVIGADFTEIENDSSIIVTDLDGSSRHLSGERALGYLRFSGASTSNVEDIQIYRNHPKFPIMEKICQKVSEQKNSQLRGLTQRGESRVDPPFARDFLGRLEALGWVTVDRNDLVSATPLGRPVLSAIASGEKMAAEIVTFMQSRT